MALWIDSQPCRIKRVRFRNARTCPCERPHEASANGNERCRCVLALPHPRNKEEVKDRYRDLENRRPVTDCLASDVQLQRNSFVVTDVRSPAQPLHSHKRSALAWGCPLNIIYTGHRRSHDGINNHSLQTPGAILTYTNIVSLDVEPCRRKLERTILPRNITTWIPQIASQPNLINTRLDTKCHLSHTQRPWASRNHHEQTAKCCSRSTQHSLHSAPQRRPHHPHHQTHWQANHSSQHQTHGIATPTPSSSSTQRYH